METSKNMIRQFFHKSSMLATGILATGMLGKKCLGLK